MATRESINSTIMALLDNLRRYPEDRTSIWRYTSALIVCMKVRGGRGGKGEIRVARWEGLITMVTLQDGS